MSLYSSTTPAAPALAKPLIEVQRWPTEMPLFTLAAFVSTGLWFFAVVSIIGIIYAVMLGVFFFLAHLMAVTHIRGSGVKLGPDQFPELYARVHDLAVRMGIERVPDVYLMQAGGTLNAFATRFLGKHIVVLFSDLLEACGTNTAARDMIIAHELGHVRANHLKWHWFLLPAHLVPFLGTALSRAREYTCDRYGLAGAGDQDGALLGLTILAAGGAHGPLVNRQALVRQQADLNTGWMTLGEWLSTHPPLARRLVALDPTLGERYESSSTGLVRAMVILAALIFLPSGALTWFAVSTLPDWASEVNEQATAQASAPVAVPDDARQQVAAAFAQLQTFVAAEHRSGRGLPETADELFKRWKAAHPDAPVPLDPYDGYEYGYERLENRYRLWSSGPDQASGTEDDIVYESPEYAPITNL